MEMTLSKTCTQSITIKYQTWKYSTTLTRTIKVESADELLSESEKLWKQAKTLTENDLQKDEPTRDKWLMEVVENNYVT